MLLNTKCPNISCSNKYTIVLVFIHHIRTLKVCREAKHKPIPGGCCCQSSERGADVCERGWRAVMYEMHTFSPVESACGYEGARGTERWRDIKRKHDDSSSSHTHIHADARLHLEAYKHGADIVAEERVLATNSVKIPLSSTLHLRGQRWNTSHTLELEILCLCFAWVT